MDIAAKTADMPKKLIDISRKAANAMSHKSAGQEADQSAALVNLSHFKLRDLDANEPLHGIWTLLGSGTLLSVDTVLMDYKDRYRLKELTISDKIDCLETLTNDEPDQMQPWTLYCLYAEGAGTCAIFSYTCVELGITLSFYLFNPAARSSFRAGVAFGPSKGMQDLANTVTSNLIHGKSRTGYPIMKAIEDGTGAGGNITGSAYSKGEEQTLTIDPYFKIVWKAGKNTQFLIRPMHTSELKSLRKKLFSELAYCDRYYPYLAASHRARIATIDDVLQIRVEIEGEPVRRYW